MKSMYKKIVLFCITALFCSSLMADEKTELKSHFLSKIDEVILIVENKTLSKDRRNGDIVKSLTPMFDFELMARLSLGSNWKKLKSDEKQRFVTLYVERMKQSYSSKIDAYKDEKVEVKSIDESQKNKLAFVTDLISKDTKLEITYKFYKPKEQKKDKDVWLIYDVEILGVSILKTDIAQFKEFLRTKTISELMDALAKQQ